MFFEKRITVYVGNFGSGKTELSIFTARQLAQTMAKVALVDLDIVNPYFKASSRTELLEQAGITVIAPNFAGTTIDLPTLSPRIALAFQKNTFDKVVMDVAGENAGARVLGRYAEEFNRCCTEVQILYVINVYRPDMSHPDKALAMLRAIERRSGLRVDGLVNNANLANYTAGEDLLQGDQVVGEVAERTGYPVIFSAGRPAVVEAYTAAGGRYPTLPFVPVLRPDWLDNT